MFGNYRGRNGIWNKMACDRRRTDGNRLDANAAFVFEIWLGFAEHVKNHFFLCCYLDELDGNLC